MSKPSRPVLRWHGGKWKLAPWIIEHFPPHLVYVEPFGGAASVLLQKPPAITDVWNDLEDEVVNLFQVLRDQADDLAALVALTPFSRAEYHSLYGPCTDPLERARRFVARSFIGQSSKGALRKSGFDSRINPDGYTSRLGCLRAVPAEFRAISDRFASVIIEHRPALAVIEQYDRPDALFYIDPPYLGDHAKHYTHELDEAGHVELLEALRNVSGMVALSGYPSSLYEGILGDWRCFNTTTHADTGQERTEALWLNPASIEAIGDGPLFDGVAA